jgi:hypothetical protein
MPEDFWRSGPSSALGSRWSVMAMGDSFNSRGDYSIEISGWGLDHSFFAERTDLQWTNDGEKQVHLRRALPEGAIVFIRLLNAEPSCGSVPVAYQIRNVVPMDRNGRCQMELAQLHPRVKQSLSRPGASNTLEEPNSLYEASESDIELQHEEILR